MKTLRRKSKWLPAWEMPSDPVKAVLWFFHWLLRVLVRYFFILIIAGIAYETYLNGVVGFFGTLLVGLLVWAGFAVLLVFINFSTNVSRVMEDVNRIQHGYPPRSPFFSSEPPEEPLNGHVVEGTITDLEEERRKRRHE
ncbi:MAG TPA: hypothetical protein VFA41_19865 [Ktedonobacteraceae bacterium]|nr:hypothetical protein [Ktedonobacteraceae bacterium]